MINHLPQRIYTAIWLGTLGFLLIPTFAVTFNLTSGQLLASTIISFLCILTGFFYTYKNLLHPAEQLGSVVTRATAAAWGGTIASLLVFIAIPTGQTPTKILVSLFVTLIFMLISICYGYKLLEMPKISYKQKFPTMQKRINATLWFGAMGALIQTVVLHNFIKTDSISIIVVTAYLGFAYGWRILVMPASIKATFKSIMLGFIGSSFIVLVFALLITSFAIMLPTIGTKAIIVSPFIDKLADSLAAGFYIFLIGCSFACVGGMMAGFGLYFLALVMRCLPPVNKGG